MSKIIYIAVPYSHEDPDIQEWRYERVTEATGCLIKKNLGVFYSPITHTHPINEGKHGPITHKLWVEEHDLPFLRKCSKLLVLMLPKWEESVGVRKEMNEATALGIPIVFASPCYDEMFRIKDVFLLDEPLAQTLQDMI